RTTSTTRHTDNKEPARYSLSEYAGFPAEPAEASASYNRSLAQRDKRGRESTPLRWSNPGVAVGRVWFRRLSGSAPHGGLRNYHWRPWRELWGTLHLNLSVVG